jgi:hypothetical protein
MASDRAIDSATVLASVSYALSERDSEITRLRRRSDKQYTDRRLLLWLHAEAVHKLGLDTARVEHAHDKEELRRQLLDALGDDAQTEAALRVILPVLVAHEYTEDQALAELDAVKAKVKADVGWNEAIDWLLNSRHTADPDIQSAFWGMAEGRFTRKQADTGCFQYDDEGNAYIPTDDEQPDTEATEQAPRCGEAGHNREFCDEPVPDGYCSEHGEVGPQPTEPAPPQEPQVGTRGEILRGAYQGLDAKVTEAPQQLYPDDPGPRVRVELPCHSETTTPLVTDVEVIEAPREPRVWREGDPEPRCYYQTPTPATSSETPPAGYGFATSNAMVACGVGCRAGLAVSVLASGAT